MGFLSCETGWRAVRSAGAGRAPSAVAMKMVSSPEIVPTTSGHSALSTATATLAAAPILVLITVMDEPAGRTARTNCASAPKSPLAREISSGGTR